MIDLGKSCFSEAEGREWEWVKENRVEKWTQQMLTDFMSFAVERNRKELVAGELCMVNKSCFVFCF